MKNNNNEKSTMCIMPDGKMIHENDLPYWQKPSSRERYGLAETIMNAKLPNQEKKTKGEGIMSEGDRVYRAIIEKYKKDNNIT